MQHWILDATAPTNSLSSAYIWIPYIIAGLAILALVYLYLENKKLKEKKAYYKSRSNNFEIELQQRSQTIATLTSQKEQLVKELADSELDRKSLEDRLRSLEMKKAQPKAAPQSAATTAPITPAVAAPVVKENP